MEHKLILVQKVLERLRSFIFSCDVDTTEKALSIKFFSMNIQEVTYDDLEIFNFYPHDIKKVLYLREIEDSLGNGIIAIYKDQNNGFYDELVYIPDRIFAELVEDLLQVKDIEGYKKVCHKYTLVMNLEKETLSLEKMECLEED